MATIEQLKKDPSTPYWAKDLMARLEGKDPVDVSNVMSELAGAYAHEANKQAEIMRRHLENIQGHQHHKYGL